jgi:hypothetical protein
MVNSISVHGINERIMVVPQRYRLIGSFRLFVIVKNVGCQS